MNSAHRAAGRSVSQTARRAAFEESVSSHSSGQLTEKAAAFTDGPDQEAIAKPALPSANLGTAARFNKPTRAGLQFRPGSTPRASYRSGVHQTDDFEPAHHARARPRSACRAMGPDPSFYRSIRRPVR